MTEVTREPVVVNTVLGPITLCTGCYYCARTEDERQRYLLVGREGKDKTDQPRDAGVEVARKLIEDWGRKFVPDRRIITVAEAKALVDAIAAHTEAAVQQERNEGQVRLANAVADLTARLAAAEGTLKAWVDNFGCEQSDHAKTRAALAAAEAQVETLGAGFNQLNHERDILKAAVEQARVFIEYARHELEPGLAGPGDLFPRQEDADKVLAALTSAPGGEG